MQDYSASFVVSVIGAPTLELSVDDMQFVNQDKNVNWAIACNQLELHNDKTSFSTEGIGRQIVVTDLAPGDYECTFNAQGWAHITNKLNYLTDPNSSCLLYTSPSPRD